MSTDQKRRGRPPKAETELRRNNPTFRCTDDLLERLRLSAETNGRSLNKEIEDRLEKSFEYNEMNMSLLKSLYDLSDPIPTVFDMAMLWNRAKTTAERRVRASGNWFDSDEKMEEFIDYYKSNIRRFLIGIAARERAEAADQAMIEKQPSASDD